MSTKVCVEIDPENGNGEPTPVESYVQTIGDGTSTSFTINHGLGTSDLLYSVRNLSTGELDSYDVTLNASNPNSLVLTFASAPAANGARVVLLSA
jgi:hypothetical protein